jgi:hypothetical protein
MMRIPSGISGLFPLRLRETYPAVPDDWARFLITLLN